MWCTPTKQETSPTGLFWDRYMDNWNWQKMTHLSILWFFFVCLFVCLFVCFFSFCFVHTSNMFSATSILIYDWFLNIFPQKFMHFLQPVKSKTTGIVNFNGRFPKITLPEKSLKVLYTNGHISKSRSMDLILISKIKLKVCSLQWCQKLISPKISFVVCFVRVLHKLVSNITFILTTINWHFIAIEGWYEQHQHTTHKA